MHIGLQNTERAELEDPQGYHWAEWDAENVGTTALRFKFFVPTMYDRSIAPEGGQIVVIQKVTDIDFDPFGAEIEPVRSVPVPDRERRPALLV